MKTLLASLLLAFAASAVAADGSPVTGQWRIHTSIGGTESDQTCSFSDDNGRLTGTCNSDSSGSVKVTGRVDDVNVTWSYTSGDDDGNTTSVRYYGHLDAGRITGTVAMGESGTEGDFIARPLRGAAGGPE